MEKRHDWLNLFSLGRLDKKGLSEIITTLIIILVSLVAIFAVWVVVRNVIEKGSQEISFDKFSINLEIQKVTINPGSLDVTVKRNVGAGTIKSLKFIVYDGTTSQTLTVNDPSLDELGVKIFSLSYDGLVKEISIAPVFDSGALGNPISKKYTDLETFKNLGLISWWRFEESPGSPVLDQVGGNTGNWIGTPGSVNGKFGKAANFSGGSSYINVPDNPSGSLDPQNGITIAAWVNEVHYVDADRPIVVKTPSLSGVFPGYQFTFGYNVDIFFRIANNQVQFNYYVPGVWKHMVATYNGTMNCVYINGVRNCLTFTNSPIGDSPDPLWIGRSNRYGGSFFRGAIDEVMIFDRALSPGQIGDLKNYTFS
jgi:hypothetical protein